MWNYNYFLISYIIQAFMRLGIWIVILRVLLLIQPRFLLREKSILRCPSAKRDGPNIATRAAALVSGTEAKVDASKSYVEIVVYKFRTLGKICINRFVLPAHYLVSETLGGTLNPLSY